MQSRSDLYEIDFSFIYTKVTVHIKNLSIVSVQAIRSLPHMEFPLTVEIKNLSIFLTY